MIFMKYRFLLIVLFACIGLSVQASSDFSDLPDATTVKREIEMSSRMNQAFLTVIMSKICFDFFNERGPKDRFLKKKLIARLQKNSTKKYAAYELCSISSSIFAAIRNGSIAFAIFGLSAAKEKFLCQERPNEDNVTFLIWSSNVVAPLLAFVADAMKDQVEGVKSNLLIEQMQDDDLEKIL